VKQCTECGIEGWLCIYICQNKVIIQWLLIIISKVSEQQ
jgi:hypothetical protein